MRMLLIPLFALFTLFMISPAFGLLNITKEGSFSTPAQINTGVPTALMLLHLNSTGEQPNITAINFTFDGLPGSGNFSGVFIHNDTNANNKFDLGVDLSLGSNSSVNDTVKNVVITFSPALAVPQEKNVTVFVVVNLSANADVNLNLRRNFTINMSGNNTVTASTIQIDFGADSKYADSKRTNITDLHAVAELFPKRTAGTRGAVADTNTVNQTLTIEFNSTGTDFINFTQIRMPENYSVVSVVNLTKNGNLRVSGSDYTPVVGTRDVNITFGVSDHIRKGDNLTIKFNVNTSAATQPTGPMNVFIHSANITAGNFTGNITQSENGALDIVTKTLINVKLVEGVKTAALVNDTDYWEFRLTINFTDNVTGLLQYYMNPWNNSNGQLMNMTNATNQLTPLNSTRYYANLRVEENSSRNISVLQFYNISDGISVTDGHVACCAANVNYEIMLRMTIPSGTAITNTWAAVYYMLFRTQK